MRFECLATDGAARRGRLEFARGTVETPAFMPVGTLGTVKGMTPEELRGIGTEILLGNTFHLMLRPGAELIRAASGLHRFMHWEGPILTDSGGFQVWSLAALRKLDDAGVTFRSPVDGTEIFLGPEESIAIQQALGSDIMMVLDECTPYPAEKAEAAASMRLSLAWATRSRAVTDARGAALFGIVQGGIYPELRAESLSALQAIGFDGYAVGGLAVGEPAEERARVLDALGPLMPAGKPRYLMGVGRPEDLVEAVSRGMDMFDCVLPTRNGRNGQLFTRFGVIKLKNACYRKNLEPPDSGCGCYVCRHYSLAYLRHLHTANEILGARLASWHNLHYYQSLMAGLRAAIERGELTRFRRDFYAQRAGNPRQRMP
ncbi:MAG: tRNA guanosine(34) transglycosylase Tgt [Gammaproteobacteria bacterium]